jgi:hypothetical protein
MEGVLSIRGAILILAVLSLLSAMVGEWFESSFVIWGAHGVSLLLLVWIGVRDLRAENARLRRALENAEWNLAGCELVATGHVKPGAYSRLMAGPALRAVSRLAQTRRSK